MNRVCTKCGEAKPEARFPMDRTRGRRVSRCQDCSNATTKAWRSRQPDYDRNRYQATKLETRERHLVRKYGVTLADYARMLKEQGGGCAICGLPESDAYKGSLHVDHCHATGAVRGLLCRGCNHILGHLKDDPELLRSSIQYLAPSPRSRKSSGEQS